MQLRYGTGDRVSLVVVSEVRIYREGISSSLACCSRFDVVGMPASTADALQQLTALRPDIIVLDVSARPSCDVVCAFRDELASVKVVAFGIDETEEEILAYAECGVAGYVGRDASMDDLVAIVASVARGELICSPRMAATLLRCVGALAIGRAPAATAGSLTSRERQVLACLRESLSNKEIAQRLNIAEATVKNHVHNLLAKLQITKRTQTLKANLPYRPSHPVKGSSAQGV